MDDATPPFIADEPAPRLLRGIGVALLVAMAAALALVVSTHSWSGTLELVLTVLALAVGAAGGILLLVCRITVVVGPDDVAVAFPPVYVKRLAVADIESVRDVPRAAPSDFGGGTGLRFASGNRVALLFHAGPATEISTSTGRTYVVVVQDSQQLTAAVSTLIEPTA